MSGPEPSVAVLGGGAAGLLAAHGLRRHGCRVALFEAADRVGGVIRMVRRGGWTIDTGAITLAEPRGELAAVLESAGAMADLVAPEVGTGLRYLVHRGRPVPVPTTTAEMLASPLLSVAGRLRMLREPFVARGGDEEETVAAFARRRFGPETAARFIEPLVSGTSGGDPDRLLAAYTFPRLVEYERRSGSVLKGRLRATRDARRLGDRAAAGGWSARGGLATLTGRLGDDLADGLRLGARVAAVTATVDGIEVELASGHREQFDAAIVALPAAALGAVRWRLPGPGVAEIAGIPHASLATVALGYRRERVGHPLDGHGVLAPAAERRRLLAVTFVSTLFGDRAPSGHVLLTAVVGGVHHQDLMALGDADLVGIVAEECAALLGTRGDPEMVEVTRWPDAMPLPVAGHAARLAAADAVEAASGRVAFCGAWRDGLAVGDAMLGGLAAADRLADRRGWSRQVAPESR